MDKEFGVTPEVLLPKRRARVFFVRHGEPVVYGEDTSLTEAGIEQIENFADFLTQELADDPTKKIVKILKSDRARTTETAGIIDKRIHDEIRTHNLSTVISKSNIQNRHSIYPDGTIDVLLSNGVALEDAYMTWLSLSKGQAEEMGAKWSGDVAKEAFTLAHNLGSYIHSTPFSPNLYYVMATHETTLGAILLHSPFEAREKIGYAQYLEIEAFGNNMCIKSNGNVVGFSREPIDWNLRVSREIF